MNRVASIVASISQRIARLPPGRGSSRGSLVAVVAVFASGNALATALQLVGGFLVARFTTPAILGQFSGMGIILGYLPFLQLGVLNGLNRELPFYIGKGDRKEAEEMAAASQAWALLLSLVSAGVLAAVGGWQAAQGRMDLALGWGAYAIAAIGQLYGTFYLAVTYRTRGDFARLAMISSISAVVSVLLVGAVWLWGFQGLCMRLAIGTLLNVGLLWYWRPVKVRPHWDWPRLRGLIKIGAPIFAVGQLIAWWDVLNKTLILRFMGTESLGLFQLAIIVSTTTAALSGSLAQVLYPRMAEAYGRDGSISALVRMGVRPSAVGFLVAIPAAALGWVAMRPVIEQILPQYALGIPAAQWILIMACLKFLGPVNNIFAVVRRLDLYAIAGVVGMVAYALALWAMGREGFSLTHFAQAQAIGWAVLLACSWASFLWLSHHTAKEEQT